MARKTTTKTTVYMIADSNGNVRTHDVGDFCVLYVWTKLSFLVAARTYLRCKFRGVFSAPVRDVNAWLKRQASISDAAAIVLNPRWGDRPNQFAADRVVVCAEERSLVEPQPKCNCPRCTGSLPKEQLN